MGARRGSLDFVAKAAPVNSSVAVEFPPASPPKAKAEVPDVPLLAKVALTTDNEALDIFQLVPL